MKGLALGIIVAAAFFMFAAVFASPALATLNDATITDTAQKTGFLGLFAQKSDYVKLIGSDVGLTSAWTQYRFCNPDSKDLLADARDQSKFDWYVTVAKGSLKDWHFEVLSNVPYTWYSDDMKCTEQSTPNSTKYNDCKVVGQIKHTDIRQEWKAFEPVGSVFKVGACHDIRFIGQYSVASDKHPIMLDNVMQFAGNTYEEYAWWSISFIRKRLITITNPAAVQQKFIITYDSDMSNGFDDLRFTDSTEATELNYWIDRQNTTNGTSATVWVSVPDANSVYVYYKNTSAVYDASDGTKTFEFFDDFNDNSINTTKWIVKGTNKVWEKNGYLAITGANAWLSGGVATNQQFNRTSTGYLMSLRYPMQETLADDIYLNSEYGDFTGTGNLQYVMNIGDAYGGVANTTVWAQQYRNVSTAGWVTVVDGNVNIVNSRLNMYLNQTRGYQWYVNSSLMASTAAMDANNKNNYNFTVEQYVSTTNGTIDDFYVAKLATTPPTYTIGAEESTGYPTSVTLLVNDTAGDISMVYGGTVNATATINVTGLWVGITHNGTLIVNDTSRAENDTVWGAGIHQFTAFYRGNGTYTDSANVSRIVTISQAPTTIRLAINGTEGDVNTTYPAPSNATAWTAISGGNISLLRNGTLVNSSTTETVIANMDKYTAGIYNFTTTFSHDNYTASPVTRILNIGKNQSGLALASSAGWNIATGSPTTITCSNTAGQTMTLTKGGTTIPNPYTAVLGNGTFVFVCTIPDSANYTPASVTNTLIVTPIGAGCINAIQFGYYTEVAVSAPETAMNFSSLVGAGTVRYDLGDVYLNTTNATLRVKMAEKVVIVNSTNVTSFWLDYGNFYSQVTQTEFAYTNTTMTNFSQNEFSPYRYDLTLMDEMLSVQRIPPNTTAQSLTLFCTNGSTIVNMTGNNMTQFVLATTAQLSQMEYTVAYSPTSFYFRDLLVSNPIEAKTFYLIDATVNQAVQDIITVEKHITGWDSPNLKISKLIGDTSQIITELPFDLENKALAYLINGQQYTVAITSGTNMRAMGNLYADNVNLQKTIVLTDIVTLNSTYANTSYALTYNDTTGVFTFAWRDAAAKTLWTSVVITNFTNQSQVLFSINSTNSSNVGVTYTVPAVNQSYIATIHISHSVYGLFSLGGTYVLSAIGGFIATIPALITAYAPPNSLAFISGGILMMIPMMFGGEIAATGVVIMAIIALFAAYVHLYPVAIGLVGVILVLAILNVMSKRRKEFT